jgi:four helix bundle protein
LADQLRRAAVSVPTNIAEGSRRKSRADFAHFLNIAEGSSAELDSLLLLIVRLGYRDEAAVAPLLAQVDALQRMLVGFRGTLEKQN